MPTTTLQQKHPQDVATVSACTHACPHIPHTDTSVTEMEKEEGKTWKFVWRTTRGKITTTDMFWGKTWMTWRSEHAWWVVAAGVVWHPYGTMSAVTGSWVCYELLESFPRATDFNLFVDRMVDMKTRIWHYLFVWTASWGCDIMDWL